ncbi:sulfite reductase, ferredoxin dependent [Leptolyngbya cf. ectocarpi LEGE 11479]|uniref:Sulfite reductase [ferredoxin] n=1 Tax=Leptolyngbya cf. ectocarpi LEGE 11479 TaxID=1828722 RepID=A0A928ZVU3_LEPEC|nr:sulfite reductase, ferredoxin dependent [Leptolyngbya ectocarpi]MBE9068384.1 sulfite reductase, ferredoxin dependent [Leptolyngbya cf. ectocarpi LEGE 11479]
MVQSPISPSKQAFQAATPTAKKVSKLEGIKERSQFLREPVATEIAQDTTHFTEEGIQILKFHGSYQQDNRDNRVKGQEKDYRMMLRTRNPGGLVSPELYLTLDELSDTYGYGNIRATTRQAFQLHGILKKDLKATMAAIIRSLGSTLGACGDLNRNVMAVPAPFKDKPEYVYAREYADRIADLLTPQTSAYYEIWLDGEKAVTSEEHPDVVAARQRNGNGTIVHDSVEPIYGTHYMPRKFKCSVTVPGDNSVDAYTQDVTLVVIVDDNKELLGFNVLAGGGMGRTHNKEETFARVADEIGYVDKDDVYDLLKAIVATQRDYGNRVQRRNARMKYLINDWGVDKFRTKVEEYFGKKIQPYRALPEWKFYDYLGWHEQGDGKLFLGVHIENGRIYDNGAFKIKSALKEIQLRYRLPMRLTSNQSLLLTEIEPADKAEIDRILRSNGIDPEDQINLLHRYAMACPALPTCGLAVTESERVIPSILDRIQALLNKMGLKQEHFVIRMTGCPNGCARPYMAELGFVGSAPNSYQLWLGGSPNQIRLAQPYMQKMNIDDLETTLEPMLAFFKKDRQPSESFGDFCDRIGFEALRDFSTSYVPAKGASGRRRHRVGISGDVYVQLKEAAAEQGVSMAQIAESAIAAYLNH